MSIVCKLKIQTSCLPEGKQRQATIVQQKHNTGQAYGTKRKQTTKTYICKNIQTNTKKNNTRPKIQTTKNDEQLYNMKIQATLQKG